ncbi:MAG: OadG family protein [Lachnospiraceae bacterium]|nr:OadG family protein [Lachnospiraceae bacterium]
MKKTKGLLLALLCVLGLSACGGQEAVSENEQQVLNNATMIASQYVVPTLTYFTDGTIDKSQLDIYTNDALGIVVESAFQFPANGYAFRSAVDNFVSGAEEIGGITSVGDVTKAEISGTDVIVDIQIFGGNRNAEVEVILANDIVTPTLKSAALNPQYTMGEKMKKAALNTLIGMGTVFVMLIIIAFIISLFTTIPKLLSKKKAPTEAEKAIDSAVAQIEAKEVTEAVSDDSELIAVIAAAIAAYEGSTTTDGFVVRSIKKAKR